MGLGLARRIPYVGTAMAITSGIQNIYLSEREKNRLYQGMEGGSNASGFGERWHEEAYRWTMPGMSGDMARESFKGVTALGYNGKVKGGQGRQDALDFVYHNYNARGMDVDESLGFVQTASRDATVNFKELSSALKDVSDTAGKFGVNAKVARQGFQGLLDAAINTGSGGGSTGLAQIFSSTQASYGREFQNVNMSGQLDTGYQYMIGAQYGVAPGQLQKIMRNQPGEYARMVTGSRMSFIKGVLTPEEIADLQALIKKYGNSTAAVPAIEKEFLDSHTRIDLNVIAETLSGQLTGVQLDRSNVMDWIIHQLAGNTAAAHTDQTSAVAPVDASKADGAQTGKFGLIDMSGGSGEKVSKRVQRISITEQHADSGFLGLGIIGHHKNRAGEVYADAMEKSGKRDPVLEAILQNVKEPNKTDVRVNTATGDRIVSLSEAMKYFPNELARGNVQLVSGNQSGKTISDVVQGHVDSNREYKDELANTQGQKVGQTVEEYGKKHKLPGEKKDAPSGGKVTVDLSDEAKRLFKILDGTGNESSATGYPPYNPNSAQGSRP
jgi:hypothetical protein